MSVGLRISSCDLEEVLDSRVPVLWGLLELFGPLSLPPPPDRERVDRQIWLLKTRMMIILTMMRSRTTEMRTIMMGKNRAGLRLLSISMSVVAD